MHRNLARFEIVDQRDLVLVRIVSLFVFLYPVCRAGSADHNHVGVKRTYVMAHGLLPVIDTVQHIRDNCRVKFLP